MNPLFILFPLCITFLLSAPIEVKAEKAKTNPPLLTSDYFREVEKQNQINYNQIVNTAGSYIPSMCYSKTILENEKQQNPCYACHIQGIAPNFINTTHLQLQLDFPPDMRKNPYSNLFKDRSEQVSKLSQGELLNYIRTSNYIKEKQIQLQNTLPEDWPGYRADAFFRFDKEGFDHKPNGVLTLWRAYRYYPFPGTFWPTNGNTDDVLIRLSSAFSEDENLNFDLAIYKINLAIVESLIKGEDVELSHVFDERFYGEDLNQNGKLDVSNKIVFPPQHYVGHARKLQRDKIVHLAVGLFPENTEFLHSVRYLDWDDKNNRIKLSARMKELRYAKKTQWFNYSELKEIAQREFLEKQNLNETNWKLDNFRGSPEEGLSTDTGWIFQGFIEDKIGNLRPQTREETIYCMGCHAGTGATVDTTFSFARKFPEKTDEHSWQHWSQKNLVGVKEPKVSYQNYADVYEYSFYLQNNPTGNEFVSNDEVLGNFFDKAGNAKPEQFDLLHNDISILLYPSFERAMELNKGYKLVVEEQSFIYGREGNITPFKNVHKTVKADQMTSLKNIISR